MVVAVVAIAVVAVAITLVAVFVVVVRVADAVKPVIVEVTVHVVTMIVVVVGVVVVGEGVAMVIKRNNTDRGRRQLASLGMYLRANQHGSIPKPCVAKPTQGSATFLGLVMDACNDHHVIPIIRLLRHRSAT